MTEKQFPKRGEPGWIGHEWKMRGMDVDYCIHCNRVAMVGDGFKVEDEYCEPHARKIIPDNLRELSNQVAEQLGWRQHIDGMWAKANVFNPVSYPPLYAVDPAAANDVLKWLQKCNYIINIRYYQPSTSKHGKWIVSLTHVNRIGEMPHSFQSPEWPEALCRVFISATKSMKGKDTRDEE